MADTKSKKASTKVFDVAKPGKTAPTATSKPVITHRPVLQDPMVVNIEVTEDSKPLSSPSEVRRKVQINPLHDELGNDIAPGAPEVIKTFATKKADITDDGALVLDLPPEVTGEKPVTSAPEVDVAPEKTTDKEPKSETPVDVAAESVEDTKVEAATEPDKAEEALSEADAKADKTTETETGTDVPESEPITQADVPAEPEATAPLTKEPEEKNTNNFGLMPEPPVGDEGQTNPDAIKQKAQEEAHKLAEEQEKIIESGAYYLPIDSVAHRRAVRHTVIGIVLVLLFGVLLLLAALDAEMITINGFPAPTDYL